MGLSPMDSTFKHQSIPWFGESLDLVVNFRVRCPIPYVQDSCTLGIQALNSTKPMLQGNRKEYGPILLDFDDDDDGR